MLTVSSPRRTGMAATWCTCTGLCCSRRRAGWHRRWGVAGCAAVTLLAGVALAWRERRAAAPLVDVPMLAATGSWPLLAGVALAWRERRAAAPLVDVPMLAATGSWPLLAGALCACLVLFGPLVLIPQVLTGHGGSVVHAGLLAAGCAAALAVPAPDMVIATWLGLLGVGLGTYIPANNTAIMTAIPPGQAAAAGGMVNMARGLGTAPGWRW